MTDDPAPRIDTASRTILANAQTLFRAFIDAETLANWRTPDGMSAEILAFDARINGGYEMLLRYDNISDQTPGKSAPGEDRVRVRFVEILPEERIEEEVYFLSDHPAFAAPMTLVTRFIPIKGGTKVVLEASNVPAPIAASDHRIGMEASLRKLALITE